MPGDPLVDRIGRTAIIICVFFAAVALALWGVRMAAGVLGGGLLIGISFYTLGHGVAALAQVATAGASGRQAIAGTLLKLALRYALLGFLAYVMIARLRLHPLGLLAGASSVTAAVSIEALRSLLKKNP